LLGALTKPRAKNSLLGGFATPSANTSLANSLLGAHAKLGAKNSLLGGFATPAANIPSFGTLALGAFASPVKRKAFFSFHFDDVMRASVVRKAWKFTHPESAVSFYDSSLWEARKLEGAEAVKRLIREGVCNTSAVCVLVGSETWRRRWVRYEIARAIIDGRGLLAVHLNSITHPTTRTTHTQGFNPLAFMALGKEQDGPFAPASYYLYEFTTGWFRYGDYTDPVKLPSWLRDPAPGYVTPLADGASVYDYMADDGHKNIGLWIDWAAQQARR
jgi:hypothetical protein